MHRLVDGERVRIGSAHGPAQYTFEEIAGGAVGPGDTVLVVDRASRQIRWYAPGGEYIRSFGREGEGPGEFGLIGTVLRAGDTLVVADRRLRRTSYVSFAGQLLRIVPRVLINDMHAPVPLQLWGSTQYLAIGEQWHEPPPGVLESEAVIVLVDPDGPVDTVATAPGSEHYWHLRDTGSLMRVPFANGHQFSLAVIGNLLFSGNGARYEIRGHDISGKFNRLLRVVGGSPHSGHEDRAALRAQYVESARNAQVRRWFELEFDAAPRRDAPPAFTKLLGGLDGILWVREGGRLQGQRIWAGFDLTGRLRHCVAAPPNVDLVEAAADYWLGIEIDTFGVERVVRWDVPFAWSGSDS